MKTASGAVLVVCFCIGFTQLSDGAVQTSSTVATTPVATPAVVPAAAAAIPAAAGTAGNTKVNLTLNVEGVKIGLDSLTVNLSGLHIGIDKLTLIAEVNLPPLLPQLGEVVGSAGKLVGPATKGLTDAAGNLVGPTTKALTDTTGRVAGGGKESQPGIDEPVEEVWVQNPSTIAQHHHEYFKDSHRSVESESVCSNQSNDEGRRRPSARQPRELHKKGRVDWMASLFPSFY